MCSGLFSYPLFLLKRKAKIKSVEFIFLVCQEKEAYTAWNLKLNYVVK